MRDLGGLLDPRSVAIAGLSSDPAKHGRRVFANLRKLGFAGDVWGVNPGVPQIEGIAVYPSVADLPVPPDLVVCAVPASATVEVVSQCSGVGAMVVFASGFGETGPDGLARQVELSQKAAEVGVRMLGPNSGGVIRPGRGLAASFLTCLDRPADQIRTGPVGVVTQSGGTGSYLHNLAAARGGGLAVSVSTGNEGDIKLGEAVEAVARLDEVKALLALVETVRDGLAFIDAVETARSLGKPVVVCRVGTSSQGKTLMRSHTGAMAVPEAVLSGVLDALGVVVAELPGEAYEVAEMLGRIAPPAGKRSAIVTHSGGMAILLADLAERHGLHLPSPSTELETKLGPLLDHGAANNPLDMGGIIGGPARFGQVVDVVASSGEYDSVLAVSTAHPPAHTEERVASLLVLQTETRLLHLWMAGDQAAGGLRALRAGGVPVTEDPLAAVRALAGLGRRVSSKARVDVMPVHGDLETWGLPLVERRLASSAEEAADAADDLGYPVVVKVESPGLVHKTDVGGVQSDLGDREAVEAAFHGVIEAANAAGFVARQARVERYRPGLEMIVGALLDDSFGPLVSVGLGGIFTELIKDVTFAPAPVDVLAAQAMIDRLRGRRLLDGLRGLPPADRKGLAEVVSLVSRGLVGTGLGEVELNPLIWEGREWVAVDWMVVSRR